MSEPRCKHNLVICSRCVIVTDAARRMSDTINMYLAWYQPWDIRNSWLTFRLSDGTSDGSLYDNKREAVRHQLDEKLCCYFSFRNALGGVKPLDCQLFLNINRHAYEHGGRLADPDDVSGGPTPIVRSSVYDRIMNRGRMTGGYGG